MADPQLLTLGVGLAILAVFGGVAYALDQSVIPAYIVAGLLVGPYAPTVGGVSFAVVPDTEVLRTLADLGVILLLFFLGVEFDPRSLLERPRRFLAIGVVDLTVNFGLGFAVATLFGYSLVAGLFVGGIVYISSSAIVTKGLLDLGWIADPESQPILAVLVFEDLAIAVYLAVLSAVALGSADLAGTATSVGVAFAFIVALFVVAELATDHVERLFESQPDEVFTLGAFGAAVLVGGIAVQFGVSEAVTAFFVGATFGRTTQHARVDQLVGPLRDAFAATFFFTIGLATDVRVVDDVAGLLVAAVAVSVVGKLAGGFWTGRIYDLSERRSLRVGIGLLARGEFSVVLAALAATAGTGVVARDVPAFAVGYVLVMSILGTVAMRHSAAIERAVGVGGSD